jgi:integrase
MTVGVVVSRGVMDLRRSNLARLPKCGWGELILTNADPRTGARWTDSGAARQRRELKHRPPGEIRMVPVYPELVALLREHVRKYPPRRDGLVFIGPRGGHSDRAYLKVFHQARDAAFSKGGLTSLLARRPYDLRHAAVSTWLNAGVSAPQVAEWAGHGVEVLMRVYAKCISGQQDEAMRRIEEATRPPEDQ